MSRNILAAALVVAMSMLAPSAYAQTGDGPAAAPAAAAGAGAQGSGSPHQPNGPASSAAAAKPARRVKARVLVDGTFGKCNQVVLLEQSVVDAHADAVKAGAGAEIDTSKAAVAYAESIAPHALPVE